MNKKILSTLILCTSVFFSATPAFAQSNSAPNATMDIYVAPEGECSDNNTGTKSSPICTLKKASDIAEGAYTNGNARGDVNVKFLTGKDKNGKVRSYTFVEKGQSQKNSVFTFSPVAGHTVRFIPEWYSSNNPATVSSDKYVNIRSANVSIADAKEELITGISVSPIKNRGGNYQFEYLNIQGFMNGLYINGGISWEDKYEKDPTAKIPDNGVFRGANAPINGSIVKNVKFEKIGNIYGDRILGKDEKGIEKRQSDTGNAALLYRNTTNNVFENNTFNNILNKNYNGKRHLSWGHLSYGIGNSGSTWKNNTFTNVNMSVLHSRGTNNEIINNNNFINTANGVGGTLQHVGRWHQWKNPSDKGTSIENRFKECPSAPMKIGSNIAKNNGKNVKFTTYDTGTYSARGSNPQHSICSSPNRVYPPKFIQGYQDSPDTFMIKWGAADTNGNAVKKYEIWAGTTNENAQRIAVVPETQKSYKLTSQQLQSIGKDKQGDAYVYVQAVNEKGNKSSRTANRIWFSMNNWKVQKSDAPIQVYTWDRKVTDTQSYPAFPAVNASYFSGAKKLNIATQQTSTTTKNTTTTTKKTTPAPVYREDPYSGSSLSSRSGGLFGWLRR